MATTTTITPAMTAHIHQVTEELPPPPPAAVNVIAWPTDPPTTVTGPDPGVAL